MRRKLLSLVLAVLLALATAGVAAAAIRADLLGVDLLPTRSGYVVLELNGAVDLRPLYGPDVYVQAIHALLAVLAVRRPLTAAALRSA